MFKSMIHVFKEAGSGKLEVGSFSSYYERQEILPTSSFRFSAVKRVTLLMTWGKQLSTQPAQQLQIL